MCTICGNAAEYPKGEKIMRITPTDAYEEAKYPDLETIEKRMRRTGLPGKGTAAFAMAVATAMTMTMCGANAASVSKNATDESSEANALTTEDASCISLAGEATIEEETALAGLIAIEETMLAGDIYVPDDTQNDKDINDTLPPQDVLEVNIAGGKFIDEPTETARAD
jgi:hypothetical protein